VIPTRSQHYSGLLVTSLPGHFEACIRALEGETGVTVSIRDPVRDRMIVVLEAPSRDLLEKLHRRVCSLPDVVTASSVIHFVDDPSRDAGSGRDLPFEPS
jgi:nitrate reductase NapAB chaperone NapD